MSENRKIIVKNKESTIPLKNKIGYGVGDFSIQLLINAVCFYLLFFYTDVYGLDSSLAGVVVLVARIVQAFMNPVIGLVSDLKEPSSMGKKRPFLLYGAIPMGISFFFLFAAPQLDGALKLVYAFFTAVFFFLSFSFVAIPYSSLTAVLTMDTHERSSLSAWRMVFAILGILVASGVTKPFVALFDNDIMGFRVLAIIFGTLGALVIIITFLSVRERHVLPTEGGTNFRQDLRLLFYNGPFLILSIASLFFLFATNTLAAVVNYYFKYNLQAEKFIPMAFFAIFLGAAVSIPFYLRISRKIGKKRTFRGGMGILALVLGATFTAGELSLPMTVVQLVLVGIGMSPVFLFPWSMVPDTVEYLQWKRGCRREGMLYGYFVLFFNMAAALSGFASGVGLDIAGYIPHAVQGPETIYGIRLLMTIVPCVSVLIGIVILSFYPIDEEMHKEILKEIHGL
jgi:GPH family glycoside/pentoside/hexuronide:cation symporter